MGENLTPSEFSQRLTAIEDKCAIRFYARTRDMVVPVESQSGHAYDNLLCHERSEKRENLDLKARKKEIMEFLYSYLRRFERLTDKFSAQISRMKKANPDCDVKQENEVLIEARNLTYDVQNLIAKFH